MAEYNVTVGRETHKLPSPYFVLATQNPLEQDGTYPLPEAQLDRFMYKLIVGYPTLEQLDEIMNRTLSPSKVEVKRVMGRNEVLELRAVSQRVGIVPSLQKFALRVLQATHPLEKTAPDLVKKFVREGASPRAGQAILSSARVRALMRGEPMVTEQDIIASAVPSLRHRLILNFEGEAEGINRDDLIRHIIEMTPRT
jgi:MoxR-like ATPase